MFERILIDATSVNIAIPGGGAFGTKAHIEAMLALFPGLVDIMHPEEAHIHDPRYTTIDVPQRTRLQALTGMAKGQFHRGSRPVVDYLKAHPDTYKIVFLNSGFYAGAIIPQIRKYTDRIIVLHHNFESEYQLDSKSVFTFGGRCSYLVNRYEKKGYLNSDINLFVTEQDLQAFEKAYGKRQDNYISGTFEPTNDIQPLLNEPYENSIVITCALGDRQNQDSIIRFAERYLPVFREILPDWRINLMGRNPTQTIHALAEQNEEITVVPNPPDLRTLAAKSAIYVCPMDAGGGIKLRILDGLRAGQPVLTHVRSARGFEVFADEPFFRTYSDTDSFKKALSDIIGYLQSPAYSRAQVQKKYYEFFSLRAGTERLRQIICKSA